MTSKMRVNIASGVSLAGVVVCVLLLILHLQPEAGNGFFSCGSGMENPCLAVSLSPYSSFFGFPVAGAGLCFYLVMLFILLFADYAGGEYLNLIPVLLLPLSLVALSADAVLAIALLRMKVLCALCVTTYALNLSLAVLFTFHILDIRRQGIKPLNALKYYLGSPRPDRKAALASCILFVLFLVFSVFTSVKLMQINASEGPVQQTEIDRFIKKFYGSPVEKITLPDTPIVLGNGNAQVEIVVFTDFLCTACSELYRLERYLFTVHGNAVKISLYHYPLDSDCNRDVKRTIYNGACTAAHAVTSAALIGRHKNFIISHYRHIGSIRKNYTSETAFKTFGESVKNDASAADLTARFRAVSASEEPGIIIKKHIDAAIKLHIDSTPTFFITGRRISGVPPFQYLDAIIRTELTKNN